MIGRAISHYSVIQKVRDGGWGWYTKPRPSNFVALSLGKFLPENVAQDTKALDRFRREL